MAELQSRLDSARAAALAEGSANAAALEQLGRARTRRGGGGGGGAGSRGGGRRGGRCRGAGGGRTEQEKAARRLDLAESGAAWARVKAAAAEAQVAQVLRAAAAEAEVARSRQEAADAAAAAAQAEVARAHQQMREHAAATSADSELGWSRAPSRAQASTQWPRQRPSCLLCRTSSRGRTRMQAISCASSRSSGSALRSSHDSCSARSPRRLSRRAAADGP
jgi:hypothetical protein